jgi:lipoxygenase homology domain-containing protein 1
MHSVHLRVQKRGFGSAWHLASVEVCDAATGEAVVFTFNDWVNNMTGWDNDLTPNGVDQQPRSLKVVEYAVTVHTSDLCGAGMFSPNRTGDT